MALTPKNELSREEKRAKQENAQQEALLREVDEAVRQSDAEQFLDRWGKPLFGLLIAGLVAFGGYLYWDSRQEAAMERDSEALVGALDQIQSGNIDSGYDRLEELAGREGGGAAVAAAMMRAGIAEQQAAVAQARAQLAQTNATIPQLEASLKGSLNRIAVLTGQAPGDATRTLETPAPIPQPSTDIATGIPADTLRQRPDVRSAERALAAATARIGSPMAIRSLLADGQRSKRNAPENRGRFFFDRVPVGTHSGV